MINRVKIQLPVTTADLRTTAWRVYRIRGIAAGVAIATVPVGTLEVLDDAAAYGDAYYYTAVDEISGNESSASPASRVFRRLSTMPVSLQSVAGSVVTS